MIGKSALGQAGNFRLAQEYESRYKSLLSVSVGADESGNSRLREVKFGN
jgi:hypothetical protein